MKHRMLVGVMDPLLTDRFEKLWERGRDAPDVFAFLANDAAGYGDEAKLEVLLKDQELRWAWGTKAPLRVEDYLERLPELVVKNEMRTRLAIGEFQARLDTEFLPTVEEFTSRFPEISEVLRSRLPQIHTPGSTQFISTAVYSPHSPSINERLGRYRLIRPLGEGAFGRVWLGLDEELLRQVAIKVPRPDRFRDFEDLELYLSEARAVAELDHPQIVPVYDVGRTESDLIYVVSKFIEGQTLKELLKSRRPAYEETAQLLAGIALALQHAHEKRLIHRDIKPANILIENDTGAPYLTDFGLAIKEEDYLFDNRIAGTPAYMSPEQTRGEGHRLDGRSDLFALGVVLYELLTGHRPFAGSTRHEILHQVISVDPLPPRDFDGSVPPELERICLKALSKRCADRYRSAAELAEDLSSWQQQSSWTPRERAIVPRGLRSFDLDHAAFFLDLLPGPRDRDGLPESVRFWKKRLEETDPDQTFPVGLIYGPSGCGKTSFMKAGLLPRLDPNLIVIYIEATPQETELRILRVLRKKVPDLPANGSLAETLALLRCRSGPKVVLVLDQFEQWLHAHRTEKHSELVTALRQCDGGRLQSLVMVRDDFWMAISRFMADLELDIVQGINTAAVDLFSLAHAQEILKAFGLGYQVLSLPLSEANQQFIEQSIDSLAQDGKVVPVRLALFGETVKSKPWVPATLSQMGGIEGVGVNFLEETFASRIANPKHRVHQQAARQVLGALLPEVGIDIKGHMRSHAELLDASGYGHRPEEFENLLRILDGELRLITPTDPSGSQSESGKNPDEQHYQLTHDYLVPSLGKWLTRKQKETRKGRAELRLAECAADWTFKPSNRRLPKWWEFLNICLWTRKRDWSESEGNLMRTAAKVHGLRFGLILAVSLILGMGVHRYVSTQKSNLAAQKENNERQQADLLVEAVLNAPADAVPYAIQNLKPLQTHALPSLERTFEEEQTDPAIRLRATIALAAFGTVRFEELISAIGWASGGECNNIVEALNCDRQAAVPLLRQAAEKAGIEKDWRRKSRIAVCLVQLGDGTLAREMFELREDPIQRSVLIDTLSRWHGSIDRLVEMGTRSEFAAFRSGLCLGLGGIPESTVLANRSGRAIPTLKDWYLNAPDGGTHSAARWALRQWQQPLPEIPPAAHAIPARDWQINLLGMTMVRVPPRALLNGAEAPLASDSPFWISACEVSRNQFREFIEDSDYPASALPRKWPGADEKRSPTWGHPVQQVSWIDAVLFCNWLSHKEQRRACYQLNGNEWVLDPSADGYRLPMEEEWERACRAGTTTDFHSGDAEESLDPYAVFRANHTQPCAGKMPNGWGLFDLHGNVFEWCQDRFPGNENRHVLKSGAFDYPPEIGRSGHRESGGTTYRSYTIGFRPVRSDP